MKPRLLIVDFLFNTGAAYLSICTHLELSVRGVLNVENVSFQEARCCISKLGNTLPQNVMMAPDFDAFKKSMRQLQENKFYQRLLANVAAQSR